MGRLNSVILGLLALGVVAGCSPKQEAESTAPTAPPGAASTTAKPAALTANPQGSVKVGDKAVCAICAVKEGTSEPEEVKAVLDYKGKTYAFCNEAEKAEFISNTAKYAQ